MTKEIFRKTLLSPVLGFDLNFQTKNKCYENNGMTQKNSYNNSYINSYIMIV